MLVDVVGMLLRTRAHYPASPPIRRIRGAGHNTRASNAASLYTVWGGFIVSIWDILFPKRCVGCGALGRYFCSKCIQTLKVVNRSETVCPMCGKHAIDGATHPRCRTRYGLDGLTSVFWYRGIARQAVKAIKYRRVTDLSHEVVATIPTSLFSALPSVDILVPIPLHRTRYNERGFNHAEVLGKEIAHKLNIPLEADILRRIRQTPPQVSLRHRGERLNNLSNAFESKVAVPGRRILLFDDVYTTGATMRSAAAALKKSGAALVWGLSMAR